MPQPLSAHGAVPVTTAGALMLPEAAKGLLHLWLQRSRTRWALRQIEPSLLDDIGITPRERDSEVRKPFWKA